MSYDGFPPLPKDLLYRCRCEMCVLTPVTPSLPLPQGVGSRLMAKMGYQIGKGLGKREQGRVEPVPIVILPPEKTSDLNCAELKLNPHGAPLRRLASSPTLVGDHYAFSKHENDRDNSEIVSTNKTTEHLADPKVPRVDEARADSVRKELPGKVQRKSLDAWIEIKEKQREGKLPTHDKEKRSKKKKKLKLHSVRREPKQEFFDFLNTKLKKDHRASDSKHGTKDGDRQRSGKELNVKTDEYVA
ncbi:Hypp4761 [Branchiostoma lanceolatum]|uniref:Hypp4761 protein n=1 Tax=Branchiostoma lanceolatum TaxID=7740 RepID=A0A8K0AB46_BRALA|nr:Hypp4761 [Branchiostoma lanceolatum]